MSKKTAFITGITGQDGSYLSELLLSKGYKVIGLKRYSAGEDKDRLKHVSHLLDSEDFHIESGDICDSASMISMLSEHKPDEIYNLAAQSHVGESFRTPINTTSINAVGPLNILEAMRVNNLSDSRFYQASTSELFGDIEGPQCEETPFSPVSPYACAKLYAHNITATYRKSYGMYACSGILFNHESPRRGEHFVTRKITKAAANIKLGNQDILELGNLKAKRDWGFAGDYVEAMWLMLNQDEARDYIIATGETHEVGEFVEEVFSLAGLKVEDHVRINPKFYRPHDVPLLLGDSRKAERELGWKRKVDFKKLAKMMYEADLLALQNERKNNE